MPLFLNLIREAVRWPTHARNFNNLCIAVYPPLIKHGNGQFPVYRWCSLMFAAINLRLVRGFPSHGHHDRRVYICNTMWIKLMITQSYTIPHHRVYRWSFVTIPRKMGLVYVRSLIGTSKAGTTAETAGTAGTAVNFSSGHIGIPLRSM